MVALTGIEADNRQFDSVQLGLSGCDFSAVGIPGCSETTARTADVTAHSQRSRSAPVDATIGARGRGSGSHDPYKALKTTLKAEIDEDVWSTGLSDTSRPFDKPNSGRIAVKVINYLGDEVMKVLRVA
jgi:hypothetical protein